MPLRSLLILGLTAVALSRSLFFFFDDPEGPNLLIVMVAAVFVYLVSLAVSRVGIAADEHKRFWVALLIQIVLVMVLAVVGRW